MDQKDLLSRLEKLEQEVKEQKETISSHDTKIFKLSSRVIHLEDQVRQLKIRK